MSNEPIPSITDEYERLQKLLVDSIDEIESLKIQLAKAIEVIIFYSDLKELEDTHEQLDWSLVNNPAAIQDKGKRARQFLIELEENNDE